MIDEELYSVINAGEPPSSKPAALWTADELGAFIERLVRDVADCKA
jgi:hypothetical protein